MQINNMIKKSYSEEIANFVKEGGEITQAVNTNKQYQFNSFDAEAAEINAAKPTSQRNLDAREKAAKQGKKSYVPVAPCGLCMTSERSVRSNACLECDRRRQALKTKINDAKLTCIGEHLITSGKDFSFFHKGKKYILQAVEAAE